MTRICWCSSVTWQPFREKIVTDDSVTISVGCDLIVLQVAQQVLSIIIDDVLTDVAEPWVLYGAEISEEIPQGRNILSITPHFLTNINRPELNHKINGNLGLRTMKKILSSQQKLVYESASLDDKAGTKGKISLKIEPLEGATTDIPAIVLAEGPWKEAFLTADKQCLKYHQITVGSFIHR